MQLECWHEHATALRGRLLCDDRVTKKASGHTRDLPCTARFRKPTRDTVPWTTVCQRTGRFDTLGIRVGMLLHVCGFQMRGTHVGSARHSGSANKLEKAGSLNSSHNCVTPAEGWCTRACWKTAWSLHGRAVGHQAGGVHDNKALGKSHKVHLIKWASRASSGNTGRTAWPTRRGPHGMAPCP